MAKAGQVWRYRVFKLSGVDERYVFLVKFVQENLSGDQFFQVAELGEKFLENKIHLWIPKDECEEFKLMSTTY